MAEKIVLQTPRKLTTSYVLPAHQAIEVGGAYREAALIVSVLSNSYAGTSLSLETASEPLEGSFLPLPQDTSSLSLATGAGVYFLYLRNLSRYLRYRVQGSPVNVELVAEVWLKKRI
ncbi:MAG: hypothetical protein FJ125_01730 [Deltaproteobacteria bacterium]|nr:hypothetical protein [Deltaproteobacteria bacterium]